MCSALRLLVCYDYCADLVPTRSLLRSSCGPRIDLQVCIAGMSCALIATPVPKYVYLSLRAIWICFLWRLYRVVVLLRFSCCLLPFFTTVLRCLASCAVVVFSIVLHCWRIAIFVLHLFIVSLWLIGATRSSCLPCLPVSCSCHRRTVGAGQPL